VASIAKEGQPTVLNICGFHDAAGLATLSPVGVFNAPGEGVERGFQAGKKGTALRSFIQRMGNDEPGHDSEKSNNKLSHGPFLPD